MSNVDIETIYQSIKEDNLALFSAYIEGKENLSFGRFPILSICYMFEANKIISKYKVLLGNISKYQRIDEPFELYKKFRECAGKTLRLYRKEDSVVTPLEMLAILEKDSLVKKLYKTFYTNETIKRNLKSIYKMALLKIRIENSDIDIERRPLARVQKRVYGWSLMLSVSFVFLISLVYALVIAVGGMGIPSSPCKIYNEVQLYKALATKSHFILERDLQLSELKGDTQFSGVLDGDGKTLYIDFLSDASFISNNLGTIKNLNIVYTNIDTSISNKTSLFVGENSGEISRVNIYCYNINLVCNKSLDRDVGLTGFAITNNGNIIGSTIMLNGTFIANGDGECFVSGFAIDNNGSIKDCTVLSDSSIDTSEADASGFVINNAKSGLVYKCDNNCTISQVSSNDGWSPTVAGVVLTNYGTVEDCINRADLSVVSENHTENAQGVALNGGISANNYGDIVKCLNTADIKVKTENIMLYAGGVTAYSGYYVEDGQTIMSSVINCGANTNLDISTTHEKAFVFAGGISGYMYGTMRECFSMSTFTYGFDEERWFAGTAIGAAYLQYQLFGSVVCIISSENYVLSLDNVEHQIGALINNGSIVNVGLDTSNNEVQTLEYASQIMQKEVFWGE